MLKIILFISGGVFPIFSLSLLPTLLNTVVEKNYSFSLQLLIYISVLLILHRIIKKYIVPSRQLNTIQGFGAVGISWFLISIYSSIPYIFSGINLTYIDILFETISGLTTTGSSILIDIESVDKSLLIWRSTTQWLGGMGIIVLTITILPLLGSGGINLFKAESPGPSADRLTPRFQDTARLLWVIYISFTFCYYFFLKLDSLLQFHCSLEQACFQQKHKAHQQLLC